MVTILNGHQRLAARHSHSQSTASIPTSIRGPSGIFRALRTFDPMLAIARDMQELCPNAIMLNYTNPMAMLCHAMQRETDIAITGLCHSVQGTSAMLAGWLGLKPESIDYVCAGINHMAFFTEFKHKGRDLIPRLRKLVRTDKAIYNHEQVRNEMFIAMGYYVTESSGHNSEYNWWFRKRPDLIKKHGKDGTGWNPGEYAHILKRYRAGKTWKNEVKEWLPATHPSRSNAATNTQPISPTPGSAANCV